MTSHVRKLPFTLECLSKEELGLSLPDPKRHHQGTLSRALKRLMGQNAERQANAESRTIPCRISANDKPSTMEL